MPDLNNPYAPPMAAVADVVPSEGPAFQPVRIFGAKGRIGRLRYVAYMFAANIILGLATLSVLMILGVAASLSGLTSGGSPRPEMVVFVGVAFWAIFAIALVLFLIFFVRVGIQRSHDMNLSGWFVLLTFLPFVALGWMFVPGSKGANRFGAPPPPNSAGVKTVFWVSILLSVAGALLAITLIAIAIPKYQEYTERARQMQTQQE